MENLMNKVASDLKNYSPLAPEGLEERIQKALSKKKSFWAFSLYTLNVYVVAMVGTGLLALVFANRGESNFIAETAPQASVEVKATPGTTFDLNSNGSVNLIDETVAMEKVAPVKTERRLKIVRHEPQTTIPEVENFQTSTIVETDIIDVAESIEVQNIPVEIQVTKVDSDSSKPKGRLLKLTRYTGK